MRRSLVAGLGLALLAPLAAPGIGSATPIPDPVVQKADSWMLGQQQPDGGFEVVNSPGFETPDVVLAFAQSLETGTTWDASVARSTISNIDTVGGKDPLDSLDDLVETGGTLTKTVQAAKVVALVAGPLGISPTDFDPSNDSAEPVDLVARINAYVQQDGTLDFGSFFNGVLYVAIGFHDTGQAEPSGIVGQIKGAQRPDGSWNYAGGLPADDGEFPIDGDVDTTSAALIALRSLGFDATDPVVTKGIQFLATKQAASGAWESFGSADPNSTAVASIALSDQHIDVTSPEWRTTYGTPVTGTYVSPYTWLKSQQTTAGNFASPNDGFGLNTFATSQSVEALARQWYLADEHGDVAGAMSYVLGSPLTAPSSAAAPVASDALGANVSVLSNRRAAANAVLASQQGRNAGAADVFQQGLARAIDPSGRAYWSKKLLTITRPQMLSRLTGSSEFYRKAGATPEEFVKVVYQRVLGRNGDPSGLAYWTKKVKAGDSVLHVAQSLTKSSEFKRREVRLAYSKVLQRAPSTGELNTGLAIVAAGRVEVLMATLAATPEFYEFAPSIIL